MPDERKPNACPWCNGTTVATWDKSDVQGELSEFHYVECLNCRALGPWSSTKPEAIQAWNRIALYPIKEA